jgi:serine-type D-Ala-D-Ala carboxypeptidase
VKILRLYTTTASFLKVLKCIGTAGVASQDAAAKVRSSTQKNLGSPALATLFTARTHLCYNPDIEPKLNLSPHPGVPSDCAHQDTRFSDAFTILREAIAARAFRGCSLAVTFQGKLAALSSFGRYTDETSPAVEENCIFDIASVSKVVATTAMAMTLYERGMLDLDLPLASIVPEFISTNADPVRREITLRMLLAHCSGLPAYEKLFLRVHSADDLLEAAFSVSLTAAPDARAEYSDIGFIILGVALSRLADEPLDHFCQREIFGPLAMTSTTFNPSPSMRSHCVPTADDQKFRHRIIQGEVQDENASILGGVAGHAGLFSKALDLARFSLAMLSGGQPILHPETLRIFTTRQPTPHGTSRALGWDTPSQPSQSGQYFSPHSFGHLGYTGCSLWIDPDRQLSIALLTNRTWPDCRNQAIKQVRPRVHDAIVEALEKSV